MHRRIERSKSCENLSLTENRTGSKDLLRKLCTEKDQRTSYGDRSDIPQHSRLFKTIEKLYELQDKLEKYRLTSYDDLFPQRSFEYQKKLKLCKSLEENAMRLGEQRDNYKQAKERPLFAFSVTFDTTFSKISQEAKKAESSFIQAVEELGYLMTEGKNKDIDHVKGVISFVRKQGLINDFLDDIKRYMQLEIIQTKEGILMKEELSFYHEAIEYGKQEMILEENRDDKSFDDFIDNHIKKTINRIRIREKDLIDFEEDASKLRKIAREGPKESTEVWLLTSYYIKKSAFDIRETSRDYFFSKTKEYETDNTINITEARKKLDTSIGRLNNLLQTIGLTELVIEKWLDDL